MPVAPELRIPAWVPDVHQRINHLGSYGIIIPALLGWRHHALRPNAGR